MKSDEVTWGKKKITSGQLYCSFQSKLTLIAPVPMTGNEPVMCFYMVASHAAGLFLYLLFLFLNQIYKENVSHCPFHICFSGVAGVKSQYC